MGIQAILDNAEKKHAAEKEIVSMIEGTFDQIAADSGAQKPKEALLNIYDVQRTKGFFGREKVIVNGNNFYYKFIQVVCDYNTGKVLDEIYLRKGNFLEFLAKRMFS
jgi:hypothetical protein